MNLVGRLSYNSHSSLRFTEPCFSPAAIPIVPAPVKQFLLHLAKPGSHKALSYGQGKTTWTGANNIPVVV